MKRILFLIVSALCVLPMMAEGEGEKAGGKAAEGQMEDKGSVWLSDESGDAGEDVGMKADESADGGEDVGRKADESTDGGEDVGMKTDESADGSEDVGMKAYESGDGSESADIEGADKTDAPRKSLGRTLSAYVSVPKFGGYFIGKYAYSDQEGQHGGEGFSQRFIRVYVDGTILNDFKYRIQVQVNNSTFHMKDYYVEWSHWQELAVKVGQYKRAFLFENPYNPWDVGAGDYSQIARHLAGIGDKDGNVANGGRDQGVQVQGDLFPSKKDGHRYVHYQLQVMNGQGINSGDANGRKDVLGTLQVQPIEGLQFGIFGWTGNYVDSEGRTLERNRWAASARYDSGGWVARAEYAHSQGHLHADGWYATVGAPLCNWLQLYVKYDAYRPKKTWGSMKTIYSIVPNIQIHKNLLLQVQYNYVHDRTLSSPGYNELWGEVYVRF